ncbi:hypothetical protein BH11MYX2_BH11MYX2_23930 [soil metagenome]
MRTASRLLIASIASLSFGGLAIAQDAPAGDAPAGDGTTTTTTTTQMDETGLKTQTTTTTAPDGDASAETLAWPRSIIDRPLTLPKGLLSLQGDLATSTSSFFDPALIRLGVGYGITDDFELNFAAYSFATSDAGKGSIDGGLGYKLIRGGAGGKLDLTARAQIGYHLGGGGDLNPIGLGVHVRYKVTPKIALISGNPGTFGSPQLSVGIVDPKFTTLTLPIGVGFQATPELFVEADTAIATFTITHPDGIDPGNAFIFDKSTPLSVTAFYNAMPALDLYVNLSIGNLTPPTGVNVGDTTSIGIGARYYIGDAVKGGAMMAAPAPATM